MKSYLCIATHDAGKVRLIVVTKNKETALKAVMSAEGCPARAVKVILIRKPSTDGERALLEHVNKLKARNQWRSFELWPGKERRTLERRALNICKVKSRGTEKDFHGVSTVFYNYILDSFDPRA